MCETDVTPGETRSVRVGGPTADGNDRRPLIGYTSGERFGSGGERDEVVGVGVRLGAKDAPAPRADRRRDVVSVPAPRTAPTETDRPRPRWSQEVGAAVLLSVLGTLRDEDATTTV